MMIVDHINFLGMTGQNPLMGPNDDSLGPRFLGMAQTYDRRLRATARRVAQEQGVTLREGVYCALSGPFFETPAEIRALRALGADAVGMSTVNEVLVARHGGMRVLAFSSITNMGIDQIDSESDANHEEVLEAGKLIVPRLSALLRGILREYED
jgi:purine-nucleoside phosphorylase